MLAADRLREMALGRDGVQLLDWLGARTCMPQSAPMEGKLAVEPMPGGVHLLLRDVPTSARTGIAVRITDDAGNPLKTDSPFRDRQGRFLWCGVPCDDVLFLPLMGLQSCTSSRIQLHTFRLGRGPATPLAHMDAPLGVVGAESWNLLTWADPLVVLAVAIVHANGIVRSSERMALGRLFERFGLDDLDVQAVLSRPTPASLTAHVRRTRVRMPAVGRRTLLECLGAVAVASGSPGSGERLVLAEIAAALNVPPAAFERLLDGWEEPTTGPLRDLAAAYHALGIEPGTERRVVKKRWRELVRKHHPDLQPHTDAASQQAATEHTAILNAAFRLIDEHGLTGTPAPPREVHVHTSTPAKPAPPPAPPSTLWQRLWGLSSLQIAAGFLAVALLAFALGLALNQHAAVALAAVEEAMR